MKPIIKTVFLVLTCLFVFSSCDEKQKPDKPNELKNFRISYERASDLQKNYIETRANFLNAYLDSINYFGRNQKRNQQNQEDGLVANEKRKIIEDVRDVNFDLKILKQYIAYVEKKAKEKGLKGLGLRVYFGSYPKNDTLVKHPGFSTVFFMPTYQPEPETSKANKFFYWNHDEIIDGTDGLNVGHQGIPPNDL
ncbi:MAG: hypothetical protein ACPGTO_07015 [Polaribacter sp.]